MTKSKNEIIRQPDFAGGGLTDDEKKRCADHVKFWTDVAYRTDPIEPDKIIPAIKDLYKISGLKEPRVVIASSPFVMIRSCEEAIRFWDRVHTARDEKNKIPYINVEDTIFNATRGDADFTSIHATGTFTNQEIRDECTLDNSKIYWTREKTKLTTYGATEKAIKKATDSTTWNEIYSEEKRKVDVGPILKKIFAVENDFLSEAKWYKMFQGGNIWAPKDCFLTMFRDVLGLKLPEFENYKLWEQVAIHGSARVIHKEFCIVSDFPQHIKVDEQNRAHCANGPSYLWRDGFKSYDWHGVPVPEEWIENPQKIDPVEILKTENVEQRTAGAAIIGWPRMLEKLDYRVINEDPDRNQDHGELIEIQFPGLTKPGRFLKAQCPRNGTIVEGVPMISDIDGSPIDTVKAAQAWGVGKKENKFTYPTVRT